MEYTLLDTGVLYGVFDNRDPRYKEANEKVEYFDLFKLILPWPIVYETLRTRFVRNQAALQKFEKFLKAPNIIFLDDTDYRGDALDLSLESSLRKKRPLSMVDCLLRLVIDDPNVKIDYLLTFNPGDFIDTCNRNRVEIL
jgi:predicted nucleic acid-binding protein